MKSKRHHVWGSWEHLYVWRRGGDCVSLKPPRCSPTSNCALSLLCVVWGVTCIGEPVGLTFINTDSYPIPKVQDEIQGCRKAEACSVAPTPDLEARPSPTPNWSCFRYPILTLIGRLWRYPQTSTVQHTLWQFKYWNQEACKLNNLDALLCCCQLQGESDGAVRRGGSHPRAAPAHPGSPGKNPIYQAPWSRGQRHGYQLKIFTSTFCNVVWQSKDLLMFPESPHSCYSASTCEGRWAHKGG